MEILLCILWDLADVGRSCFFISTEIINSGIIADSDDETA